MGLLFGVVRRVRGDIGKEGVVFMGIAIYYILCVVDGLEVKSVDEMKWG